MQSQKNIKDFFDQHTDSDLWDWEDNYTKYTWPTFINWSTSWLTLKLSSFRNWLYIIYYGIHVPRLSYNRCRNCKNEIDNQYLYDTSDLRNSLCLDCYDIECQKIINDLTI